MTHALVGRLTALSDLLLRSSRRGGNVLDTLRHIPGSAVRGALAARWVERHGADERFRDIFLSGRVRFHDARADIDGHEAFVVPLSFVTSKERPLEAHTADLVTGAQRPAGVPLRRVRGEMTLDGVVRAGGPPTVVRSRIGTFGDEDHAEGTPDPARDGRARRGLAAEGMLFSETRLAAGTTFTARVSGDGTLLAELAERLLPAQGPDSLRVGRSRTVLGLAEVAWGDVAPTTPADVSSDDVHTLVALSDLVLLDVFQRSIADLDATALAAMFGIARDEVEVLPGGEVRATEVGGWDGPNRMPARVDRAVRAGSTVRFRAPADAVRRLAADPWVGWRRAEGHGHVAIDWPVHRLTSLRASGGPALEVPASDARDAAFADEASKLIDGLGAVSSTLWSQVVEAIRVGVDLTTVSADGKAGPVRGDGKDSERAAGRGAGAGRGRRGERVSIATALADRFSRLGIDGPTDGEARLALVVHAGREVRLRELAQRERRRREGIASGRARRAPSDAAHQRAADAEEVR
jgi:CRISPR-associated protein Csx10